MNSLNRSTTSLVRMPQYSREQRGAALVMALVILLILTIMGVTAMSTSSLEQKMAGNIQDLTRAFQAAESGVDRVIDNNPTGFDLSAGATTACDPSSPCSFDSGKSGTASVTPSLIQITQRSPRGPKSSGASASSTAHINLSSNGVLGNARYSVRQGVTQPAPAQN
jgi:type IV pilus assembly protein PilX